MSDKDYLFIGIHNWLEGTRTLELEWNHFMNIFFCRCCNFKGNFIHPDDFISLTFLHESSRSLSYFQSNLNHQSWMSVEEIMTKIRKLLKSECSRSLALCRVVTWCRLVIEALCHDSCPWWWLVTVLNCPKITPFTLQLVLINSKSFPSMNWAKNMYLTYIINHKDKEMKIITS